MQYYKTPVDLSTNTANEYISNKKPHKKIVIIVSIVSVCVLLFGGFVYLNIYSSQQNTFNQNSDTKNLELPEKYDIGPLGSDHAHSAMAMFIHGE